MTSHRLLASTLAAALVLGASPARGSEGAKVVLVSIDGAGAKFIERELSLARMPHLSAIRASGVTADYALTNFPSQSAPGHAALWSGTYGAINGVTANAVPVLPRAEHNLLEQRSGFSSQALMAEPIWVSAARAGRLALVAQATHLVPFDAYSPKGRFGGEAAGRMTLFDSYWAVAEGDWVLDSTASLRPASGWIGVPAGARPAWETSFKAGETTLVAAFYDDPDDPTPGYDTVQIRARKDSMLGAVVLKPGSSTPGTSDRFSPPIPVGTRGHLTVARYRLFELAADLSSLRLYRTTLSEDLSNQPDLLPDFLLHTGGPVSKGAEAQYVRGKLGRTLLDGGDGSAEERLLETIRLAIDNQIERLGYCATRLPWDLLVAYLPYPDALLHLWGGLVDPASPAYRPAVAGRLSRYLGTVTRMVDDFLGAARAVAGNQAVLAVVSDHGIEGVRRDFFPNVALRKAGLLAVDAKGRIDLARTKAFYSACNGAHVVLNTTDRKGGIVTPHQVPKVIERVVATMRHLRDPLTRRPIVTAVYPAARADASLGLGGPAGGDLYLDLEPGVAFNPGWNGQDLLRDRPVFESGAHIFNPTRPSMRTIFYMTGPGVRRGATLPPVRTIDVAPTLCHLMGIPAPAQATGRVLGEALAIP